MLRKSTRLLSTALIAALQLGCATTFAQAETAPQPVRDVLYPDPRVKPIPIDEMNAQQKALLGIVDGEPLPGRAKNILFQTLMHNPQLIAVYAPMGDMVNRAPQIAPRERELVILRVAWLYQGRYEWARHYVNARAAGWTPEDIERIKTGPNDPAWAGLDRTLLRAADQLVKDAYLQDEVWAALRAHYSVPDVMILISLVTHYHWVAMMTKSLEVEPDYEVKAFNEGAGLLKFEGSVAFVEGPATRSDGVVFFTDIPNNRIMQRTADGKISPHRDRSNHANGLYFDRVDNLLIAETDGRIVAERPDGSIEVLADSYQGAAFNSPNDLALDTKGRIYFTDPSYRNREGASQRDAQGEIVDGVYRIDGPGKVTRILTHEVDRPNGILVSPGDQFLYVAQNNGKANGARQLLRFDLNKDGSVVADSKTILFDWGSGRGPDGMTIDADGNIYVAAGVNHSIPNRSALVHPAGIYVISPGGQLLDHIPVPMDQVTNVAFGGPDYKTLFITAGHSLWTHKVSTMGYRPF